MRITSGVFFFSFFSCCASSTLQPSHHEVCAPAEWKIGPLQMLQIKLSWSADREGIFRERMRKSLYGEDKADFKLYAKAQPKGFLCSSLERYTIEEPETYVEYVRWYARSILRPIVCEDCVDGCEIDVMSTVVEEDVETKDNEFTIEPKMRVKKAEVEIPCLCVDLDENAPADLKYTHSTTIDQTRVLWFFGGILLMFFCGTLGRSRVTHALIGGMLGLGLGVLFIFYFLWKQVRNVVPFGTSLTTVFAALFALVPTTLMWAFKDFVGWSGVWTTAQWIAQMKDPYYGVPVGLGFLLASAAMGVYLGKKFFGTRTYEEVKGEVEFYIRGDGARVDKVDEGEDPPAQKFLSYALFVLGILLVMRSTRWPFLNFLVCLCVVGWGWLEFFWNWLTTEGNARKMEVSYTGGCMSEDAYEEQKKLTTERELAKLRSFLSSQDGHKYMSRVKSSNQELKVRRFVEGMSHVHAGNISEDSNDDSEEGWFNSCVIS